MFPASVVGVVLTRVKLVSSGIEFWVRVMVKSIRPRDFSLGRFKSSVMISIFLLPDKFKYLKLVFSFQFHSYLELEVLYFKSLEPTSISSRAWKWDKSEGRVLNLLPFKNNSLKLSIKSKSSGKEERKLPERNN
ncbi:hypothetical protein WICPIJ_003329 [Wickerhamomyces pijperi]|uniref:Uncharacterized protein n=1 Tax=Wickerhamomyces pijperi TaxID=599730 RepID=A0A9P8Q7J3_WICPI|nr:hypothetical protein WICPIJ_003329 [Wickerhamomyces pijperi]